MHVVRSICLASLFVVAAAAAAGGETQTNASAQTGAPSAPSTGSASVQNAAEPREPIVLEFDVPEEFRTQPAGSANAVTGFRVGFFQANSSTAVRTMDVARDALTVQGRTARVTLPPESIPESIDNGTIRVQTLSGGEAGAWSNPVWLAGSAASQTQSAPQRPTRPRQTRAARTERPREPAARARRGILAPGDIEKYVALSEALHKLLPADANIETEVGRFRRVQELALAVVISRDYKIPFSELSKMVEGPPRVAPRGALSRLRRGAVTPDAISKLRTEARRLIETAEPK